MAINNGVRRSCVVSPSGRCELQGFYKVQLTTLKTPVQVVFPGTDRRDDSDLAVTFLPGDLSSNFQQAGPLTGVLGSTSLLLAHLQGLPINMHLPDDGCAIQICDPGIRRVFSSQG